MNKKREVQYTSTLKLMQIMVDKKLLNRDESQMKHIYSPAVEENSTKGHLLDRFVDTMFNGSASSLMMQLLGNKKTSKKELDAIRELLKKMEKINFLLCLLPHGFPTTSCRPSACAPSCTPSGRAFPPHYWPGLCSCSPNAPGPASATTCWAPCCYYSSQEQALPFYLEMQAASPAPAPATAAIAAPGAPYAPAPQPDLLTRFLQLTDAHSGQIMMAWALVFLLKCIRLGAGFYHIFRIRHSNTIQPPVEWAGKLKQLALSIGIHAPVKLMESARVQMPFTVGWLKPRIYVPAGLLAQLPADQLEAILLHELAHIRRRDYLVNILQGVSPRSSSSLIPPCCGSPGASAKKGKPVATTLPLRTRPARPATCKPSWLSKTPDSAFSWAWA